MNLTVELLHHAEMSAEVRRLEVHGSFLLALVRCAQAIRDHRAQKADDRCIEDDDRLYATLGDGVQCDRRVGDKAAMLKNCERFIGRRYESGGWPTYADLEAKVQELEAAEKRYQSVIHQAAKDAEALQKLVRHCWVHSGFYDCGSGQMTNDQLLLFQQVVKSEREADGPIPF